MVKKKNDKLTMGGFRPFAMLLTVYLLFSRILQQLAGRAPRTRRDPQSGHGETGLNKLSFKKMQETMCRQDMGTQQNK